MSLIFYLQRSLIAKTSPLFLLLVLSILPQITKEILMKVLLKAFHDFLTFQTKWSQLILTPNIYTLVDLR